MEMMHEYNFNKESMIAKVTNYCKGKRIKISELENSIGVSKGYLSRLGNSTKDISPSIDIVCKLADAIKTTPEELIYNGTNCLSQQEIYFESFVQKLLKKTSKNSLMWQAELPSALPIDGFDVITCAGYRHFKHELLYEVHDEDGRYVYENYYAGKLKDCKQSIDDLIVHAEFAKRHYVYIVPMKWKFNSGEVKIGFDFFVDRSLVCSTRSLTDTLRQSISFLYEAAKRSLSKTFLSEDTKKLLEEITMNFTADDSDDEETDDETDSVNPSEEIDFEATEDLDFLGEGYISEEEICDYYDDSMSDEELFNDYDEDGTGLDLWAKHGMD